MPARQKHKIFIDEAIGDKPLTALPGIGDKLARRLQDSGVPDAKALLGGFLRYGVTDSAFFEWLRENCRASRRQSDECYLCLEKWVERNIPKMHSLAYEQISNIPCFAGRLSETLPEAGIRYAKEVLGYYLLLGEDGDVVVQWLTQHGASDREATACFGFIQNWCNQQFRERNPTIEGARMGQTTKKHRSFVNEPMAEKPVTEVPGVGAALGRKLSDEGLPKAKDLFKRCLRFDDREHFIDWLKDNFGASLRQATSSYDALKEYEDLYL